MKLFILFTVLMKLLGDLIGMNLMMIGYGKDFKTYCHYSYLSCDDIITVSLW